MAQTAIANRRADGGRAKPRQNLLIGALGVVYGDIGTSPLYTVKQCFQASSAPHFSMATG
jgi:KUP system potassium uptake protein